MTEHLDTHGLQLFVAHELAPNELLRVARHIGVCQSCRELVAHAEQTGVRIDSLQAELREEAKSVEQHLEYEQMEAYVDRTLNEAEREIASNHLAVCAPCAREVQELDSLREDLAQPTHVSNAAVGLHSENSWQRFKESIRLSWLSSGAAWAAALLVLIAAAGLLLWWRGRTSEVAHDNNNNAPKVVDKGNHNTPEVVNSGVNVNENKLVVGPANRNESDNTNRGISPGRSLNAGGNLATYEAVIKRALDSESIDRAPVLEDLVGRPSTLMSRSQGDDLARGPEGTFRLLQPVGTVTLRNRPTFNWAPLAGATSYRVHVLDTEFKVVADSGQVTSTSWSPTNPLKSGVVYLWQVSATKEGEVISAPAAPAREARFKILSASKSRELQQVAKGHAGSHLARGIIYAHTGLLDDAEREFQAALSQNQEAAKARKLLQQVNALRR